jgi:mannose/fructose/N-acetylgalactosamine-specific phosphotransferase system component IIB
MPRPRSTSSQSVASHTIQLAYAMYQKNIDAFIHATAIKKSVFAQAESFTDFYAEIELPVDIPDVTFVPAATLTPDQQTSSSRSWDSMPP